MGTLAAGIKDIFSSVKTTGTNVMLCGNDGTPDGHITFNNLKNAIVTNAPDEEDLTSVNVGGTDVLKFKDKAYSALTYSGMGRVYLRKNMVNDVNTLTQAMMPTATGGNTIYIIQYDYVLGEDIKVPQNCVLEFDGGSISAGSGENKDTITGNNTGINAGLVKIFNTDVTLNGTWNVAEAYPEWFGAKGNGTTEDTNAFINALSLNSSILSLFEGKKYRLRSFSTTNDLFIKGNNAILSFDDDCHLLVNYGTSVIKDVSSLTNTDGVVGITVNDASSFSVSDIIKIVSDETVEESDFNCSQYFVVSSLDGNTINCFGNLQFDFQTNIKVAKLQKKSCIIKDLTVKGKATSFTDDGQITIVGGVFHNISNCKGLSFNRHCFVFCGCYGYTVKDVYSDYQKFDNDAHIIGMLVADAASANFKVSLQSEYTQPFTTIYRNDGTIDTVGCSQYGLITDCVCGAQQLDNHANGYRLVYSNNLVSDNSEYGLSCRSSQCVCNGLISKAKNGVYFYSDVHSNGGMTMCIKNSIIDCEINGIIVPNSEVPNTVIIDNCRITSNNASIQANANIIITNSFVKGKIISNGTLKVYNSTLDIGKLESREGTCEFTNCDIRLTNETYTYNAVFNNCTIYNNTPSGRFYPVGGTLTVSGCIVYSATDAFIFPNENNVAINIFDTAFHIIPGNVYAFRIIYKANKTVVVNIKNIVVYNKYSRSLSGGIADNDYIGMTGTVQGANFIFGTDRWNAVVCPSSVTLKTDNYAQGAGNTRPTGMVPVGYCFFDTTLGNNGKSIWYAGNNTWVDAIGEKV